MDDTGTQGRVLRLALKIQSDQRKGDSTVSRPGMTSFPAARFFKVFLRFAEGAFTKHPLLTRLSWRLLNQQGFEQIKDHHTSIARLRSRKAEIVGLSCMGVRRVSLERKAYKLRCQETIKNVMAWFAAALR